MMDVDPNREWYFSITVVRANDAPLDINGVITQGWATTRNDLVSRIKVEHDARINDVVRSVIVHHLERNDL